MRAGVQFEGVIAGDVVLRTLQDAAEAVAVTSLPPFPDRLPATVSHATAMMVYTHTDFAGAAAPDASAAKTQTPRLFARALGGLVGSTSG